MRQQAIDQRRLSPSQRSQLGTPVGYETMDRRSARVVTARPLADRPAADNAAEALALRQRQIELAKLAAR
jgi:hypothetical protein